MMRLPVLMGATLLSLVVCGDAVAEPPPALPTALLPPPAKCESGSVHATDAEIAACRALTGGTSADTALALANLCEMLGIRGRYDEALQSCNAAITIVPRSAEAWTVRGKVYRSMGDFDRAIGDLTKAIAYNRSPIFDYLERANTYKAKGDYDHLIPGRAATSAASYNRSIADAKRVQALARKLAAEKRTIGSVIANFAGTTIEEAKRAKASLPPNGRAADAKHWCEGKDLPKGAIPAFGDSYNIALACTALIQSGGVSGVELGEAYFHRARAPDSDRLGAEEELGGTAAIPDYEKAISLGAEVIEASYSIGAILAASGEGERAIPYLDTVVAAGGIRLEAALAARTQAHALAGHYDAAMADFARAVELKPDDPQAFLGRSLAYLAHRDYDRALADCATAAKAEGRFALIARARRICGNAHFFMKDYAAAIADYDGAEHTTGPAADVAYARAIAKFKTGDVTGAQADIKTAFFMDSNVGARGAKLGIVP